MDEPRATAMQHLRKERLQFLLIGLLAGGLFEVTAAWCWLHGRPFQSEILPVFWACMFNAGGISNWRDKTREMRQLDADADSRQSV